MVFAPLMDISSRAILSGIFLCDPKPMSCLSEVMAVCRRQTFKCHLYGSPRCASSFILSGHLPASRQTEQETCQYYYGDSGMLRGEDSCPVKNGCLPKMDALDIKQPQQ